MNEKEPCVYILASKRNGTLYIGATSGILQRIYEHKSNLAEGFTQKYKIHTLVYYEFHSSMDEAFKREKQIKKWKRKWKLDLIEKTNKEWKDLYYGLI